MTPAWFDAYYISYNHDFARQSYAVVNARFFLFAIFVLCAKVFITIFHSPNATNSREIYPFTVEPNGWAFGPFRLVLSLHRKGMPTMTFTAEKRLNPFAMTLPFPQSELGANAINKLQPEYLTMCRYTLGSAISPFSSISPYFLPLSSSTIDIMFSNVSICYEAITS